MFANIGGNVLCLDANSGDILWRYDAKDSVPFAPTVVGDSVVFTSYDDTVRSLSWSTGELEWEFVAEDGPTTSALVVGDRLYFGGDHGSVYCLSLDPAK